MATDDEGSAPTAARPRFATTARADDTVDSPIKTIDDTGANLPVPVAPVSAFTEDDFAVPPSTELPSARWRRRGGRTIIPLVATAAAAAFGMFLLGTGPYEGIGMATIACVPLVVGVLMTLYPGKDSRRRHGTSVGRGVLASFIATLVALPLIDDGAICLLFALPVTMSLTAIFSAAGVSLLSRRLAQLDAKVRAALAMMLALLAPLVARPIDQVLFFHPDDRGAITSTVTLPFSQEQVWRSLRFLEVKFNRPSPLSLEALLPIPTELSGGGAQPGAVRRVAFDNGVVVATVVELQAPTRYGIDLHLEDPGREFFDHWIDLRHATFDLVAAGPASTTLTHTTTYRPLLYPRVVFAPIEQILGSVIQQNLVDAYALDVLSRGPPPQHLAER